MKENDATLDAAFDAAFDEALASTPVAPAGNQEGIDMGTEKPAGETPPAATEPPAGETPPATEPPATPPATEPTGGTPATPPATEPPAAPPAGPTAEERLAVLEAQLAEANAKLAAIPTAPPAAAPPAAAPPAPPAAPAPPEPPKLDEKEQAEFDEYTSNWPDHAKALALSNKLLQKQVEQLVAAGLQQVAGKVQELIAPVIQANQKTEQKTFRQTVLDAHKDLDTVLPQVKTWIESQPPYLRPAMEETMRSAPAEHVIDLISKAKKELGIAERPADTPPPAPPATPPAAPPATDPAKQGRLDRMEAVDGGASKPTRAGADPLDYDSAFDEAANRLTK